MGEVRPFKKGAVMILRLLIERNCDRDCVGCCNKQYNLDELPVASTRDFKNYEMILLTGGEPMLNKDWVKFMINKIRRETYYETKIILYTAKLDTSMETAIILASIDGITLTLHEQKDAKMFKNLQEMSFLFKNLSCRLNVFKGVDISGIDTKPWQVKKDMVWIKKCPLPKNEVFMRYI